MWSDPANSPKASGNLTVVEGDAVFVSNLKKQVWANLSKRYQSEDIRNFPEVTAALDPRFKQKMENGASVWDQIKREMTESEQSTEGACGEDGDVTKMWSEKDGQSEEENQPPPSKHPRKSPLEELVADRRRGPCPSRTRQRRSCRCIRRHHQLVYLMTLLPGCGTSA